MTGLVKRLNHQSAAETLSLVIQIWKCSQTVNGFESEGLQETVEAGKENPPVTGINQKSDAALLLLIAAV